ncbi:MAG TPA: UvrD-helicase domain-containing protein, partial [bacterium]|nr:UvrD-helicase domain-containing protein [bacterium]
MFPDFESAGKFQNKLDKLGNIRSDGRPILGLDSKKLFEIALEINENITLIPAHIWTPWFSALGSKSGFNTIEECYEDLTKYICAVETGLSSDPDMNRYCGFLDRFALISNSDAHSPDKLGREANLFDGEISYEGILNALKQSGSKCKFNGTIEFFPQEGKYHLDGHRKCGICWDPSETLKNKGICPKCGKQVTLGVLYRVMELADKTYEQMKKNTPDFSSIIPLREILGEIAGTSSVSKKVNAEYFRILSKLGPEFDILLNIDADEIKKCANEILAEGIKRLRERKVILNSGYDGEYGVIKVFEPSEIKKLTQNSFGFDWTKNLKTQTDKSAGNSFEEFKSKLKSLKKNETEITQAKISGKTPNKEQISGIEFFQGQCLIISGPGSGKTFVLTERIIHLVKNKNAEPSRILALTFSNKAADEIKIRIREKITRSEEVFVSTFHSFGLKILKKYFETKTKDSRFTVIDFETAENILKLLPDVSKKQIKSFLKKISLMKQGVGLENDDELKGVFVKYSQKLDSLNMVDIDDLVYKTVEILNEDSEFRKKIIGLFDWILIDEFQDINSKQYDLIKLIGGKNPNLFAIGDPDQSIYGFRGSDVRFIKRFAEDYAESKTINLKISYRYPEVIIKAGSQILDRNEYMSGLKCGVKISIRQCETEASEADWIARQIENMSGGLRHFSIDSSVADGSEYEDITSLGDFAVICRTSLIFEKIKTAFKNYSIPYQITGEIPFFKNEPFSAVLDFFNYLIKKKELEFAENKFDFNFEMLYLTNKNKDAMKNLLSGGNKIESLIFE